MESHPGYSTTHVVGETSSLYAPLLNKIHTALDSLAANHNQLVACQASRSQHSIMTIQGWHVLYGSGVRDYFANGARPVPSPVLNTFLQTKPIPNHLNKWRTSTNQIQAQLIKRQADTAKQQVEMCGRLMESVSNMIEKLRRDDERYTAEKEERRRQEELAWETEGAKDRFVRNWIESSAVVEIKGEGAA